MLKGTKFTGVTDYNYADYPAMALLEFKFNINRDVKILEGTNLI